MNPAGNGRVGLLAIPVTGVGSSVTTTACVDTLGADLVIVDAFVKPDVTNPLDRIAIYECDTTVVTSATSIVALTGGTATSTSAGFTVPAAYSSTDAWQCHRFVCDMRGKKRYLFLEVDAPATGYDLLATVNLLKLDQEGTDTNQCEAINLQPVSASTATSSTVFELASIAWG